MLPLRWRVTNNGCWWCGKAVIVSETITGGCFCGSIRYAVEGPVPRIVNCHCTMCRRTSGAPFVTWLVVPEDKFSYTQGTPKKLQSSDHGERYFCASCGTPVVCIVGGEHVDITLGSLDNPEAFEPNLDIHTDTKLAWVQASIER